MHGDAGGAESLRRGLHHWLSDLRLIPADAHAVIDRYLGYYEPYAISHYALDADEALQQEVVTAARALEACVARMRDGWRPAEQDESQPRPK